jgi:hypothetical protein
MMTLEALADVVDMVVHNKTARANPEFEFFVTRDKDRVVLYFVKPNGCVESTDFKPKEFEWLAPQQWLDLIHGRAEKVVRELSERVMQRTRLTRLRLQRERKNPHVFN